MDPWRLLVPEFQKWEPLEVTGLGMHTLAPVPPACPPQQVWPMGLRTTPTEPLSPPLTFQMVDIPELAGG